MKIFIKISLIILLFLEFYTTSVQAQVLNFSNNNAYKIAMKGANNSVNADFVARQMEKSQFAIFSYVDPTTSTGYFVVENNSKVVEIQNFLNNEQGYSVIELQEIPLTDELFIEMYMKRSGVEKADFSKNEPKQITMGPNEELSTSLYLKASNVWKKLYSNAYHNKQQGLPEHYPVFVNTGNPELDNSTFDQAKQEWLKNYPKEAEYTTGILYQDDKAKQGKISKK